jgi:uncharacterized membrane protein YeaQ/YmgE (transglycosylase-associated protein family)
MPAIAWIVVGLVSGFIASAAVDGGGPGLMLDMLLGVMGSFAGGAAFALVQSSDTGFGLESVFVSVLCAMAVLIGYHAMRPRRATWW